MNALFHSSHSYSFDNIPGGGDPGGSIRKAGDCSGRGGCRRHNRQLEGIRFDRVVGMNSVGFNSVLGMANVLGTEDFASSLASPLRIAVYLVGGLSVKTVQEREEHLNVQKQTATLAAERLHLELQDCQKQLSDLEVRPSPPL